MSPDCRILVRGELAAAYLTPTVGYVTTPDPPETAITGRVRLAYKVRPTGLTATTDVTIGAQWGTAPHTWYLAHRASGALVFACAFTTSGAQDVYAQVATTAQLLAVMPNDVDSYIGVEIDTATGRIAAQTSPDGVTWSTFGTVITRAPFTIVNSNTPLRVGSRNGQPFKGRIYWAQMETLAADGRSTGVVWRFDSDEYPGTGTSFVDPRNRTWTLTAAGAITPAVIGMVPFADTPADLIGREPTALADLSITWGRGNTFDQPAPATCAFQVLDRSGGTVFTERLHIGDPIEVHAAGDIAQGTPIDVAVSGGFEDLPVGPVGDRVATVAPAVADVVDAPATGTRAIRVTSTDARSVLRVPPAAFTPGNPAGWDDIPRLGPNPWTWSIRVRPPMNARTGAVGIGFADPQTVEPTGIVGAETPSAWGNASNWFTLSDEVAATAVTADDWLGVSVETDAATWTAPYGLSAPYPWTGAPGTWADYAPTYVDDLVLMAPAGGTVRSVLAFAGRITDMAAVFDDAEGTMRIDVTAVDQLADLENRYVGAEPWLAEPFADRVARILDAADLTVTALIDPGLADMVVTWRDVDNQSAGALLAELAAGVDGVLWSATHETTGEYLWIEDVAERGAVQVLEMIGGFVTIVTSSERPSGRTTIDGCHIDTAELTWIRDVSDVITRVDATWKEQTVDGDGLPKPTDRSIRVSDPELEAAYGVRRLGLTTPLITDTDARAVAERVMFRTTTPQGRVDGLTWDLGRFPPADGPDMGAALDLIDGTVRIGRALIVENADLWPDGGPIGLYLDGGRYTYDGAWTLGLIGTPLAGMGESVAWVELDPTWSWDEFDPTIEWPDLFGVAGPLADLTRKDAA